MNLDDGLISGFVFLMGFSIMGFISGGKGVTIGSVGILGILGKGSISVVF